MTVVDDSALRSYLYVPGHREDMISKALESEADAVVVDLEDAVPSRNKAAARSAVQQLLERPPPRPLWVRINPISDPAARDDVAAAASPHLAGIRIAKTESPEQVRAVSGWLAESGCAAPISCLIESALGLERAYEIARSDPAVRGIALGEADLGADLGSRSDQGLLYARSRCVQSARAAGLSPPVQSVFTGVGDELALRRSCETGLELGFFGRSAIHPRQLPVINQVYSPSPEAVGEAQTLVDQLTESTDAGVAAFTLPDGRFVDPAIVESARRTLILAKQLGINP